mgnify:FL=1
MISLAIALVNLATLSGRPSWQLSLISIGSTLFQNVSATLPEASDLQNN